MNKLEAARVLFEKEDIDAARYIFDYTDDEDEKRRAADRLENEGDPDDCAAVAHWVFYENPADGTPPAPTDGTPPAPTDGTPTPARAKKGRAGGG